MNILVDIKELMQAKDPVFKAFIIDIFQELASKNQEHHFIFITGKKVVLPFTAGHTEQVIVNGVGGSRWGQRYWQQIQLPALLKKRRAAVFITINGTCVRGAQLPQLLILAGIGGLQVKRGHVSQQVQKADSILVFSEKQKNDIIKEFKLPASKTELLKAAASGFFIPLSFEEKQEIKNNYTGGREYFIYTGLINLEGNLLNLLKAFSLFKKRQQSGIKLVLAGPEDSSFAQSLASYKYREDVVVTGSISMPEKARLVAAAYALVDPSPEEGTGIPALEAAACDVPVIAVGGQPLLENDAYLPANTKDPVDIAAQLMLLYKDEARREELIQKARPASNVYTMERSADQLWKLILERIQ